MRLVCLALTLSCCQCTLSFGSIRVFFALICLCFLLSLESVHSILDCLMEADFNFLAPKLKIHCLSFLFSVECLCFLFFVKLGVVLLF